MTRVRNTLGLSPEEQLKRLRLYVALVRATKGYSFSKMTEEQIKDAMRSLSAGKSSEVALSRLKSSSRAGKLTDYFMRELEKDRTEVLVSRLHHYDNLGLVVLSDHQIGETGLLRLPGFMAFLFKETVPLTSEDTSAVIETAARLNKDGMRLDEALASARALEC